MSQPSDEILDDNFNEKNENKNPVKQKVVNRIGISLAVISFLIGTLLLLMAFSDDDNLVVLIIGFYYLPFAFFINLLYFIFLFVVSGTYAEKKSYRRTAGIMCLNIPIAFFYFGLIMSNL